MGAVSTAAARHLVAISRGVPPGVTGCFCVCCGASPFDRGRSADLLQGGTFSDAPSLLAPSAIDACAGCVSLLAGRPGDDPPPLRTLHCLAVEGQPALYPATSELAAILRAPPLGRFVLIWTASHKRHAVLRAGISTAKRMLVGGDEATVEYCPASHERILDAVEALRAVFGSDSILAGNYAAFGVAKFGAQRWAECEALVASVRGSPLLAMLCHIARKGELLPREDYLIDPDDERAVKLLALVATASLMRAERGKDFWGGIFLHRLERVRRLPLATAVSRLMASIGTSSIAEATQEALVMLAEMDADVVAGVERSLRERPTLLVALAYDQIRTAKAAKTKAKEDK